MTFEVRARRPLPKGSCEAGEWTVRWTTTAVMGIVNVTPDSFSDGGLFADTARAVAHGHELAAAGALVVDVGGESTRPGAEPIPRAAEIDRVRPVVAELVAGGLLVSVDTRWAEVASAVLEAGAHIVNDVSGLADPDMAGVCAAAGAPVVVGHTRGTPATMQREAHYTDVVREVTDALRHLVRKALDAGVPSVLADPGIGFAKTAEHNLAVLRALPLDVDAPLVVGASRKAFIGRLTGVEQADRRDPGTVAVHLFAAQRGVALVRAHDVAGHAQALAVDRALRDTSGGRPA